MKSEQIVKFAADIITTSVETNLSVDKTKDALVQFKDYLTNQGFADAESLGILERILATLPELVTLTTVFGSHGIANLILNRTSKIDSVSLDVNTNGMDEGILKKKESSSFDSTPSTRNSSDYISSPSIGLKSSVSSPSVVSKPISNNNHNTSTELPSNVVSNGSYRVPVGCGTGYSDSRYGMCGPSAYR